MFLICEIVGHILYYIIIRYAGDVGKRKTGKWNSTYTYTLSVKNLLHCLWKL